MFEEQHPRIGAFDFTNSDSICLDLNAAMNTLSGFSFDDFLQKQTEMKDEEN